MAVGFVLFVSPAQERQLLYAFPIFEINNDAQAIVNINGFPFRAYQILASSWFQWKHNVWILLGQWKYSWLLFLEVSFAVYTIPGSHFLVNAKFSDSVLLSPLLLLTIMFNRYNRNCIIFNLTQLVIQCM